MMQTMRRVGLVALLIAGAATTVFGQTQLSGRVGLVWGDPNDGPGAAEFRVYLFRDGAEPIALQFPPDSQPPYDELLRANGRVVTVTGAADSSARSVDGRATFRV